MRIAGNGFTVLLVGSRRRLRTKPNVLIVSLAGGRFLCWFVCCSFTVFLSHQRWLQLRASTLRVLGGIYKVGLCVRLYNEPVQPRTRSVYGCRKATEVCQLHDCATCHPANFNFLGFPSSSCNLFCFHEYIYLTSSIRMIVLVLCCATLEIFSSCMLIFCFISMVTVIYKQTRSSAILAKQLRFNHRGLTFNTYDKSAVAMLALVVAFALASFATYLRCDFLQLL